MSQPYRRGSRDRRGGRNANPVAGGGPRNSGDRRNNGSPAERKGSGGSFSGRPPPGNFEGFCFSSSFQKKSCLQNHSLQMISKKVKVKHKDKEAHFRSKKE